jgi:hypothetical protein
LVASGAATGSTSSVPQCRTASSADLQVALVQLGQPLRDAPPRLDPHGHRQVVHARTDEPLDAGKLRGPPRERRAEDDVVALAQVAEQDRPGTLHHGVERQVQRSREALQRGCRRSIQPR